METTDDQNSFFLIQVHLEKFIEVTTRQLKYIR